MERLNIKQRKQKSVFRSYDTLIADLRNAEDIHYRTAQEAFESKEKNKILIRLLQISNPNRQPWEAKHFPVVVNSYERKNLDRAPEYNKWYSWVGRNYVSALQAYTNIKKELAAQGFDVKLETLKKMHYQTGKEDKNVRETRLTVVGLT